MGNYGFNCKRSVKITVTNLQRLFLNNWNHKMYLKVILFFSNKQKCSVILANSSNIYLLREMKGLK